MLRMNEKEDGPVAAAAELGYILLLLWGLKHILNFIFRRWSYHTKFSWALRRGNPAASKCCLITRTRRRWREKMILTQSCNNKVLLCECGFWGRGGQLNGLNTKSWVGEVNDNDTFLSFLHFLAINKKKKNTTVSMFLFWCGEYKCGAC